MIQKNRGITLVALVVTIIVLLILAGITLTSIIGENGIIRQAQRTKEKTDEATRLELKSIEGKIKIDGITYNSIEDYINGIPAEDSSEDAGNDTPQIQWDQVLAQATSPHPDQTKSSDIGVGTDGELVNLDLWYYEYASSLNGWELVPYDYENASYRNENIQANGKIQGTVPQYIKSSTGDNFYPVVTMGDTFKNCTNLVIAPRIPDTVTALFGTFRNCTNLTTVINIPDTVNDLCNAFYGCSSLVNVPHISNNVTRLEHAFENCSSLVTVPNIPADVTNFFAAFRGCTSLVSVPTLGDYIEDMSSAFYGCTSLATAPDIPDSVLDLGGTFYGCTSLTTAPDIPDDVTNMRETFCDCTNITNAPTIPSGVTDVGETFCNCTSLTGSLVINATNIEYYTDCLSGAATKSGTHLTLSGNAGTAMLTNILNTASVNSNVSIGN